MTRSGLIVWLLIAGVGAAEARRVSRPPPPPPPAVDVGAELAAAIRARSATRVAKLLADPLQNYGIWFHDPACAKQFGAPGIVAGPELLAFARCLTQLRLQATTRQPGSSDNAILTYEPGVELELSHSGGHVRWIGFEYQTAADRGRPTLTVQAFEALRRSGKMIVDDEVSGKLDPLLERAKLTAISAWMKVCIDDEGALDQVSLRQTDAPSGLSGKVSTAFEVAMRGWRFRPFEPRGKRPMPVCAMELLTYPATRAPLVEALPVALQPSFSIGGAPAATKVRVVEDDVEDVDDVEGVAEGGVEGGVVGGVVSDVPPPPPPPPPPPLPNVPPMVLEGYRIAGDKNIAPDDMTKTEIARSGKDKVVGSYKLCIDAQGAITTVLQLKSTGFGAYDAKLAAGMKQWRYRPYQVNGKPTAVCTAVTFIYSQQPPAPPAPAKQP